MVRVRVAKPTGRRERWSLEVLPLDPRDLEIVLAKDSGRRRDREDAAPEITDQIPSTVAPLDDVQHPTDPS